MSRPSEAIARRANALQDGLLSRCERHPFRALHVDFRFRPSLPSESLQYRFELRGALECHGHRRDKALLSPP
jgi:hypothetical protein